MNRRIMGWLRRTFGVLNPSPLFAVTVAPEWTPEDASHWNQFLKSPTGQTLWKRARAMESATCVNACAGKHEPKMAGGVSFCLNWLEGLANVESISSAADANAATTDASTHEDAGLLNETSFA